VARKTLTSFEALWQKHEEIYKQVFSQALLKLSSQMTISGNEDSISERLCIFLREVCFELNNRNVNMEIPTPKWEVPIQPVNEIELTGGKIRKRPDFTCSCTNKYASKPEDYEIPLHVECKCLGRTLITGWNYNKNYVVNGIKRFDCSIHQYGKNALSGIMIGYILNLSYTSLQGEVNYYQTQDLPYLPAIDFSLAVKLFQTEQQIERKYVHPNQFKLIHLWSDLSESYSRK